MPVDPSVLRRGTLAFGLFPFAAQFPLRYLDADGSVIDAPSIEQYATSRGGRATTVLAEAKIRPVLLLHDGTRGDNDDLVALRVNSVKGRHRRSPSWPKIIAQEHPLFFHLPFDERYRLPEESVISLVSITSVHKTAVLGVRGTLDHHEMQAISQSLQRILSLDLTPQITDKAHELLRRAGIVKDA